MRRTLTVLVTCMAMGLFLLSNALGHTPLCSCYDNGDETITCEGGFSDGSSAAGVSIIVVGENEEVFLEEKMDEDGEFTFKKPGVPYMVVFDAGPGHAVEIAGEDITE